MRDTMRLLSQQGGLPLPLTIPTSQGRKDLLEHTRFLGNLAHLQQNHAMQPRSTN